MPRECPSAWPWAFAAAGVRTRRRPQFHWGRAMVAGGLAGLLAGFIFDRWMSAGDYFPLACGLEPDTLSGREPGTCNLA